MENFIRQLVCSEAKIIPHFEKIQKPHLASFVLASKLVVLSLILSQQAKLQV
jgi:hypothetical protein